MRSNIEQAVARVVASHQEVIITNVLTAYLHVAGFPNFSMDALIAFERALDKHPDSGEKVGPKSATLIGVLRRSYWHQMFGSIGNGETQYFSCPCCDFMPPISEIVGQENLEGQMHLAEGTFVKPKKSKARRAKNHHLSRKAMAFDLYAPSTSASSM